MVLTLWKEMYFQGWPKPRVSEFIIPVISLSSGLILYLFLRRRKDVAILFEKIWQVIFLIVFGRTLYMSAKTVKIL
jgi:hypothetical protein